MDERLRFVARLLDGEKMAALCREFDVSRKTGYKIFQRYKDCGLEGLTDRSRRPYRHANQLPFQIEKLIVRLKRERPSWGATRSARSSGGWKRCSKYCPVPAIPSSLTFVFPLEVSAAYIHSLFSFGATMSSLPCTSSTGVEIWSAYCTGEIAR